MHLDHPSYETGEVSAGQEEGFVWGLCLTVSISRELHGVKAHQWQGTFRGEEVDIGEMEAVLQPPLPITSW